MCSMIWLPNTSELGQRHPPWKTKLPLEMGHETNVINLFLKGQAQQSITHKPASLCPFVFMKYHI